MVLKSIQCLQMTSPEQPASTGREQKFNSGQWAWTASESCHQLVPFALSLQLLCLPLSPSSHPGCLCATQNASLLCVHLLTRHLGGDGHRLGAKFSFVFRDRAWAFLNLTSLGGMRYA